MGGQPVYPSAIRQAIESQLKEKEPRQNPFAGRSHITGRMFSLCENPKSYDACQHDLLVAQVCKCTSSAKAHTHCNRLRDAKIDLIFDMPHRVKSTSYKEWWFAVKAIQKRLDNDGVESVLSEKLPTL